MTFITLCIYIKNLSGFSNFSDLDHPDLEWVCSLCSLSRLAPEDLMDTSVLSASPIILDPFDDEACNSSTFSEVSEDGLDSLTWYQANIREYYKFNLKIAYLNINSLINKIDETKEMLRRNMFDILFIAETKIERIIW